MSAEVRRVGFSSTPCESAAAGFVALGAMLQRLDKQGAEDLASHYARLQALTPGKDDAIVLRNRFRPNRLFRISHCDNNGRAWLGSASGSDSQKFVVLEANAADWIFDGEPPLEAYRGALLPFASLYAALMPSQRRPTDANLRSSDSAVVLAGRAAGRAATEDLMREIVLSDGHCIATLSELLAVHGWQPDNVSRVRYFNPRQRGESRFDRVGGPPLLIVADGAAAYYAARAELECEQASILTVIARTSDPATLEDLAENIAGLSQWYEVDSKVLDRLHDPPPGVTTAALRARS